MSVTLTPTPPGPARPPITGKLTIAHLRPRVPDAAPTVPARPSRDEARSVRPTCLPLKGDKPRLIAIAPRGRAMPAPGEGMPMEAAKPAKKKPKKGMPKHRPRLRLMNPLAHHEHAIREFHRLAHERWPIAFPALPEDADLTPCVPLAIGAGEEVMAVLGPILGEKAVARAMGQWTYSAPYLHALAAAAGTRRIRLDGTPSPENRDLIAQGQADFARAALEAKARKARESEERLVAWEAKYGAAADAARAAREAKTTA